MGHESRKPVRRFLLRHVLPPVVLRGYRLLGRSFDYVPVHAERFEEARASGRSITGGFLHARLVNLLHFMSRPERGEWFFMCSKSRDGELVARVGAGLGFRVVRGSTGTGGARALVELIRRVEREPEVAGACLAVDGSRGPRGVVQAGVVTLAQKTGGLLMPAAASASSAWIYRRSWDRTAIPKPGATIHVVFGEAIEVPRRLGEREAESIRREMERRLLAIHAEADERSGFRDGVAGEGWRR